MNSEQPLKKVRVKKVRVKKIKQVKSLLEIRREEYIKYLKKEKPDHYERAVKKLSKNKLD